MDGFTYPHQQNALLSQWMSEYSDGIRSDFSLDRTLYRASARSMDHLIEIREFFDSLSEASPVLARHILFPAEQFHSDHSSGHARSLSKSTETTPLRGARCTAMGRPERIFAEARYPGR